MASEVETASPISGAILSRCPELQPKLAEAGVFLLELELGLEGIIEPTADVPALAASAVERAVARWSDARRARRLFVLIHGTRAIADLLRASNLQLDRGRIAGICQTMESGCRVFGAGITFDLDFLAEEADSSEWAPARIWMRSLAEDTQVPLPVTSACAIRHERPRIRPGKSIRASMGAPVSR
jgi:hypothetical protein